MSFFKKFFSVLTLAERKRFFVYIVVLFVGSISSVFGIGAVIPFMMLLLDPNKISHMPVISSLSFEHAVLVSALVLIFAFWLKNAISVALLFYQTRFLGSVALSVQRRLFSGYMNMHYEDHLNRSTPELIRNLTTECNVLANSIVQQLGNGLMAFFSILFVIVFLVILSPVFTILIIGSLLIIISVYMRVLRSKTRYYALLRSDANKKINKSIVEGMQGIKESKLYHKEHVFEKSFNNEAYSLRRATIFSSVFQALPKLLIEVSALTVVMLTIVLYVTYGAETTQLMLILSVFGVAASQLLPSINQVTSALASIKYNIKAIDNVSEELDRFKNLNLEGIARDNIQPIEFRECVQLQDIHYSYRDGTRALQGVSITILSNKKTAFVGKSGAGKSTLVDLIMGLYLPKQGRIFVDGYELKTTEDIRSFQKLFGYIPQQIILYDASIKENVAFGIASDEIDEVRVWECLSMAQMDMFVKEMPNQLDAFVGESGIRLSGGQRQRLGIARALYHKPKILVMDEATSALDNHTERQITDILETLKDLTIITIAHRLSTIQNYNQIYMLNHGKIDSFGTYNELLHNSILFNDISMNQT